MSRPEPRYRVNLKVYLNWQDSDGAIRRCTAKCVDVSATGARLETIDQLKAQSSVIVYFDDFSRMGHAVIRFCRREGMKYSVGLQFSTSLVLSPELRQGGFDNITTPRTAINSI